MNSSKPLNKIVFVIILVQIIIGLFRDAPLPIESYIMITVVNFILFAFLNRETIINHNKCYNIPNTKINRKALNESKEMFKNGRSDKTLEILSNLKIKSVEKEVDLLLSRYATFKKKEYSGVLTHLEITITHERINRDIRKLIEMLDEELNYYRVADEEVFNRLKRQYENWLIQKIGNQPPINFKLLQTIEGTSKETAEAFVKINFEDINAQIKQIFEQSFGRLLITGKPGVGKTVLLLQLELALLQPNAEFLPIIVNISHWRKDYITLDAWLIENLPIELGVSRKYVIDILQQNRLILLLDGLDEIEECDRFSFLEAVGKYREATNCQYVITSRINEYKIVKKDAPVHFQIEIEELSLNQLDTELVNLSAKRPEMILLRNALKSNPVLREAAQVPFYLNILRSMFSGGKTLSDLNLKGNNVEMIQNELTLKFISYALTISPKNNYTQKQSEDWLSFLAFNMTKQNRVIFEVADLQYNWVSDLNSKWHLFVANFLKGFVEIFFVSIVFGIYTGLSFGLVGNFFISILFGFLLIFAISSFNGLAMGLAGVFHNKFPKIKTIEVNNWSWVNYWKITKTFILNWFISVSLVLVLFYSLFLCAGVPLDSIIYPLTCFFISSMFFITGISIWIYLQTVSVATIQINHPFQRYKNSAKMFYPSVLQYWHLTYTFKNIRCIPSSIRSFLDYMVVQGILESFDGATWRFRHRIFQDYFTKNWDEKNTV